MTTTLYKLQQDYRDIESELLHNGGELTPELEARFDAVVAEREDKLRAYGYMMRDLTAAARVEQARAESFALEAERYAKEAKRLQTAADRLRDRALEDMRLHDEKRNEYCRLSRCLNGQASIRVLDPSKLPPHYLLAQEPKVDMARLRADLADEIPDAATSVVVEEWGVVIERGEHGRLW